MILNPKVVPANKLPGKPAQLPSPILQARREGIKRVGGLVWYQNCFQDRYKPSTPEKPFLLQGDVAGDLWVTCAYS